MMVILKGSGITTRVGRLDDDEVKDLLTLSERFDPEDILKTAEVAFCSDSKSIFDYANFEFDNHMEIPNEVYLRDFSYEKSYPLDSRSFNYQESPKLEDGFHIRINYFGGKFNVPFGIDCSHEDFDPKLLKIPIIDLSGMGIDTDVFNPFSGITYDGKKLNLKLFEDPMHNPPKIELIRVQNGEIEDGYKWLRNNRKKNYKILNKCNSFIHTNYLQYNSICEKVTNNFNPDLICLSLGEEFIYGSNLFEELNLLTDNQREELWLQEEHILGVLKYNLIDEIPQDIKELIIVKHPEWLI